MPKLRIVQNEIVKTIAFEGAKPLAELLGGLDIHIDSPCGGRGACKKCTVLVNGKEELACRYVVCEDTVAVVRSFKDIASVTGAVETDVLTEKVCLCLDIGTTTLALALVSFDNYQVIKTKTAPNPQREFGADVISRIEYCTNNGPEKLQQLLVKAINEMIYDIFNEYGLKTIEKMYVAGNTTMLHSFLGVDCSSLGVSPYTPIFLDEKLTSGKYLGFDNIDEIVLLPGISAFVGADIVSGLGYVDKPKKDKYSLLVDLGTNAEIVLFNNEKYLCATAAAGPCFEGANISCGMSASVGAISKYNSDGSYSVIGGTEPEGICATGLIDIVAELLRNGTIDESGYLEEDFVLSENVRVSGADIRELQLAKSAVISAILCLLKRADIDFDDVEAMYVAGGFSTELSVENAAYIGLIPSELANRFIPINNSSLLGTVKYACVGNDLVEIVKKAEFMDLGIDNTFTELFFENMSFSRLSNNPTA